MLNISEKPLNSMLLAGKAKSKIVYRIPQRNDHSNDFSRIKPTNSSSIFSRLEAIRNNPIKMVLRMPDRKAFDFTISSNTSPNCRNVARTPVMKRITHPTSLNLCGNHVLNVVVSLNIVFRIELMQGALPLPPCKFIECQKRYYAKNQ
jgi:hypothetical protein